MYKSKFSENNTDDSRTVIETKGVSYLPLDFSSDSSEEVETQKSYNPLDLLFGNLDSFSNSSVQGVTFNGYNPRYSDLDFHSMWNTEQTDSSKNTSTDINFQETSKKTFTKEEFKTMLLPVYELALEARGLDKSFARPLVAQDGLETRWGNATIGKNNYGNITGKSGVTRNVPEYIDNEWTDKNQTFVNFSSVWDYVNAKIDLLSKSRYDVFNHPINEFAQRVKAGGYATAPNYADVLNNVIRTLRKGGILKFEKGGYERDLAKYASKLPVGHLLENLQALRSKHGKSSDNYLYEKELDRQIKLRGQLSYEDGTLHTGSTKDTLRHFNDAIKPYESQLKNSTSRERWDFIESLKDRNTKKYHLENGKAWREYSDPENLLNKLDTDSIYRMLNIIYGPPTDFTQYAGRGAKIRRYSSGGKENILQQQPQENGFKLNDSILLSWFPKFKHVLHNMRKHSNKSSNYLDSYVYQTHKTFDKDQVANDGTKYSDIVKNRVNMASSALKRSGIVNEDDINRLAYFLAMQSIRETGWIDKDPKNNYGGYMSGDTKRTYANAEEFWDAHIKNLDDKWSTWRDSQNITEYLHTINNPDWYMRSAEDIKAEQNRRSLNVEKELYLYTPAYANKGKDYFKEVMGVADRFTYYYNQDNYVNNTR